MTQLSIATALSGIESKARWLRDDAFNLSFYVKQLPARYNFELNADDMLCQAEHELKVAIERVQKARADLSAKPITA